MMVNKRICFVLLLMCITSCVFAQWTDIPVRLDESVWASSSLIENLGGKQIEYGPEALFDGELSSPWVEGVAGPGIGENVLILLQKPVEEIRIRNGFASAENLYQQNNRLKSVRISLLAGLTAPGMVSETDYCLYRVFETEVASAVPLPDSRMEQILRFSMPPDDQYEYLTETILEFRENEPFLFSMISRELGIDEENTDLSGYMPEIIETFGFFALRLTIDDVYPGTAYDDTCISELTFELGDF